MQPTAAQVLIALLAYGPQVIPLIAKLSADIKNRNNPVVTDADWTELNRLAAQTGEEIYLKLGITPPPAA